jgi:dephospho-CoA kinase
LKVVATVGRNASGKDAFVERLASKYHVPLFSMGDIARELADREGLPLTRENLHKMSEHHMKKYGQYFFADRIIQKILSTHLSYSAVTGIRPHSDVIRFRETFGSDFILVHVLVTDDRVRFERVRARASERDTKSYDQFLEYDRKEELLFQSSRAAAAADYIIKNDGTLDEFYASVDDFAERIVGIPQTVGSSE